uniref:Bestrophin homolog n=1 Tax=Rhabditophanes sp. KR3021 TaxID=114890 RepID=A0AC35TNQ7_9BILA
MTINYAIHVRTANNWAFMKLLFLWKGSVYRLLVVDLIVYLILHYLLVIIYAYALSSSKQRLFEQLVKYCRFGPSLVTSITFALGFFTTILYHRWWERFVIIPKVEEIALWISSYVPGNTPEIVKHRKTLIRWAVLSMVLTFQSCATKIKSRFPTQQHLIDAQFMTALEGDIIERTNSIYHKRWIPLNWFVQKLSKITAEGIVKQPIHEKAILDAVHNFRQKLQSTFNYDWINLPLSYLQIVTIAVYFFFAVTLIGRQHLESDNYGTHEIIITPIDKYFPIYTILYFVIYFGWLKVAQTLVCPLGDDDDDFDINQIIDETCQNSYLIVGEMYGIIPEEENERVEDEEPEPDLDKYPVGALQYKSEPFHGSVMNMVIPETDKLWPTHPEDDNMSSVSSYRKESYLNVGFEKNREEEQNYLRKISRTASSLANAFSNVKGSMLNVVGLNGQTPSRSDAPILLTSNNSFDIPRIRIGGEQTSPHSDYEEESGLMLDFDDHQKTLTAPPTSSKRPTANSLFKAFDESTLHNRTSYITSRKSSISNLEVINEVDSVEDVDSLPGKESEA